MSNERDYQSYYTLKSGLLIVVSGPSGAGKSAVCKSYVNRFEDTLLSVSETTRAPRKGEKEGREYYFISEEEYEDRLKNGYYLESAGNYNNHYGTPKEPITKALAAGKDVILEIDPQGAFQVREIYPDAVLVFVVPASYNALKRQILERKTETKEEIELRLSYAEKEISRIPEYDYVIVNKPGRLTATVTTLSAIITAEKCSVKRILSENENE